MEIHIYKDAGAVVEALAAWMTDLVKRTLQNKERFTIALSGGETPKALYRLLSTATYSNEISWNKLHVFWGDERVVPFTDASNNAKMAFDSLLNQVPVPKENIHIMQTSVEPGVAASEYEDVLHRYFDDQTTSFDLVLLGMGKDGHTLSLFPSSRVLKEKQNWVYPVYDGGQKVVRITLMPNVVNKAAAIVFLVTGSEKAGTIKSVLQGPAGDYPAQLIQPVNGNLHWFLDQNAASEIANKTAE